MMQLVKWKSCDNKYRGDAPEPGIMEYWVGIGDRLGKNWNVMQIGNKQMNIISQQRILFGHV